MAQLIDVFSLAAYGVKKNVSQPPTVTSTGVSTSAGKCCYRFLGPRLAHEKRYPARTHGVLEERLEPVGGPGPTNATHPKGLVDVSTEMSII